MGKPKTKGAAPYRRFITDEAFQGKNKEHGVTNLFRYPDLFSDPSTGLDHFADIPFLNGGLFECLDREDPDDKNRLRRIDGFTTYYLTAEQRAALIAEDPASEVNSFYEKKVIYPEITKWMGFYFDLSEQLIPNNKGFIVTSNNESLAFLVAFGNSTVFRYCFKDNFPEVMGNTYKMRKIFVEKLPIRRPT